MVGPWEIRDVAWASTALLELVLLFYILRQKLYRLHPAFSAYILIAILQSIFLAWASRHWGGASMQYFNIAWGAQGVVICVRWFTVSEIAKRVFAGYSGIWRMTSSILFVLSLGILVYSVALSQQRWYLSVLNADRAVELCIAGFIVAMLLFTRYYRLRMTNLERQLSIGFCLFSCSWVISNSIYQGSQSPSGMWWEFVEILAFLASVCLWISAVRQPVEAGQPARISTLSPEQYAQLSQQLNTRLRVLDQRLNELFGSEDVRP